MGEPGIRDGDCDVVGPTLGNLVGQAVGAVDGDWDGPLVAWVVGDAEGQRLGIPPGVRLGQGDGAVLGDSDGRMLGSSDGRSLGSWEGAGFSTFVGVIDGKTEGLALGLLAVGKRDQYRIAMALGRPRTLVSPPLYPRRKSGESGGNSSRRDSGTCFAVMI